LRLSVETNDVLDCLDILSVCVILDSWNYLPLRHDSATVPTICEHLIVIIFSIN